MRVGGPDKKIHGKAIGPVLLFPGEELPQLRGADVLHWIEWVDNHSHIRTTGLRRFLLGRQSADQQEAEYEDETCYRAFFHRDPLALEPECHLREHIMERTEAAPNRVVKLQLHGHIVIEVVAHAGAGPMAQRNISKQRRRG